MHRLTSALDVLHHFPVSCAAPPAWCCTGDRCRRLDLLCVCMCYPLRRAMVAGGAEAAFGALDTRPQAIEQHIPSSQTLWCGIHAAELLWSCQLASARACDMAALGAPCTVSCSGRPASTVFCVCLFPPACIADYLLVSYVCSVNSVSLLWVLGRSCQVLNNEQLTDGGKNFVRINCVNKDLKPCLESASDLSWAPLRPLIAGLLEPTTEEESLLRAVSGLERPARAWRCLDVASPA